MEKLLGLVSWLTREVYTKLTECARVHLGEYDRGMNLCVLKHRDSLHSEGGLGVARGGDSKGDKHLVGVKSGVVVAEVLCLKDLDRCENFGGDNVLVLVNTRDSLDSI